MKRKAWKVAKPHPTVNTLAKKYNINPYLIQILLNRNICESEFESFLKPSVLQFHDPLLLPDIEKAVKRVNQALNDKEKVLVFGDYDVDGITSLAIFNEFAQKYPGQFSFRSPHRVEEGYGLSSKAVEDAIKDNVSLIITFDCGTNSPQEVALANSANIDVIVIDHHTLGSEVADAFALINPKREDSKYPFSELSGAALSYKFLQALTNKVCYQALDLVALSLVCDVVSLRGENRSLLREGLKVIRESSRPAIIALCRAGSIRQKYIDTFHIGFVLGPRINASGRVAHPEHALQLFLTQDQSQADDLAIKLGEYNRKRRNIETEILKEADEKIKDKVAGLSAIVVAQDGWHPGVLGIVASRLADKYQRPSFVISFDQDKGKGSARSTQNVHLLSALDQCKEHLVVYGGHSRAAGLEVSREKLDSFRQQMNSFIEANTSPEDFIPSLSIDAVLTLRDVNRDLAMQLERLTPYGEANPKPLFCAYSLIKKTQPKPAGKGFSLWLSDDQRTFEAYFYDKNILEAISAADSFDIVFSLQMNYYHNAPRLVIRDCCLAEEGR